MNALVPEVAPLSRAQIEQDAYKITRDCYPHLLTSPAAFPIVQFFDFVLGERHKNLISGVAELGDGIEGMTFPDGRVLVSEETYSNAVSGDGRARMTLAHESYHGICHCSQIRTQLVHGGKLVLYRRPSIPAFRDPEWQAKTFASALLLPASAVRLFATKHPRCGLVRAVEQKFQVSRQAAEIRLTTLELN